MSRSLVGTHKDVRRFTRFLAVGVSGTLVDFALLSALKLLFGWPVFLANPFSYTAGIICNYTLNRRWTFPEARNRPLGRFVQFGVVSLIGLLLNTATVHLLEIPFATVLGSTYGYLPAKVAATGLVALWNFAANRYWTFRDVA